jgi:hypothetical protein
MLFLNSMKTGSEWLFQLCRRALLKKIFLGPLSPEALVGQDQLPHSTLPG